MIKWGNTRANKYVGLSMNRLDIVLTGYADTGKQSWHQVMSLQRREFHGRRSPWFVY
jgi:hypothetical protein